MPSTLAPTHRPFDRVQDHPLALHDDSNSLTSSHSLPSNPTDTHGSPRRPDHSQFISSSLPSPGKGHRKPVPRITSAELDDTLSQRHLSEDISRYPSTVTGHIGCATRDDRFADASGPYQMVPVDEYGVMIDLPKQLKMFSDRSRDPTVSSFEAFVLAPSTSSFTIFEKASVNKKGSREEVNGDGDGSLTEGKERKTPRSSPLKNQVKVSMESRRTITSTKASSDTIRSGATTIEVSHSSTKTKQSWNLFSRIENPNSARAEQSESSDQADPPTPSKPSPKSIITPKTQRHLRKLSVQPVSPFQIPPLSQNTESNKSPTRRSKAPHEGEKTPQITSRDMTPPASNKTIRSFSALHRASIDTPAMTQRGNGWSIPLLRVDDSPTKRKRVGTNARTLNDRYVAPSSHRITEDAIPLHNSGRIKLVAGNARNVSTTSNHGIPRVETRYLDDNDLVVRLEANERDHPVAETTQSEGDAMVGYWDYSIVTGVEGSPSRDYSMLLRNTGMLKQFVDLPSRVQNGMGINTSTSRTGKVAPDLIDEATTAPLPAPRSSSDKSLTCSSNYPDDTDDVSEHSPSNYDGKRRGRHTRRRENRPVSMASLATPLGEDAKAIEQARSVGQVVYDSRSVGVALPMGPDARINTPCESSFAQSLPEGTTDSEAGTLFTRFPHPPISLSSAAQIEQSGAASLVLRYPSPPSEKHSSLLSEILAITRESYQARKESQEQMAEAAAKADVTHILPRAAGSTQKAQRASMVGLRQGDPFLHVIHEDEAITANLPLTSESLRELDRRLADESTQRNPSDMPRTRSDGDVTAHTRRMGAAFPATARTAAFRQNIGPRAAPESLDNLSVATSTTVRPSFHGPQHRQSPAIQNMMHIVTHQPTRSIMPTRPVRGGNAQQQNDEFPEGVFPGGRQLSSPMCVCLGHRLW